MGATAMRVEAIVLNHDNYEDTAECLASLAALDYPDCRVTVVDNGSTDGSDRRLREEFPWARFILNGENLGYAEGNNRGIETALEEGADLVWLLNNDTVVEKETLGALVRAAAENPRAGLFGSVVCRYDDPGKVESAGGRRVRHRVRNLTAKTSSGTGSHGAEPFEADFVTGASLMARSSAVREIGLLDPSYFLYFEDTDWCLRARRAGWQVLVVPASRVLHKGGRTTRRDKPVLIYYVCRNSLSCCRRHYPAWLPLALASCLRRFVFNYLVRYIMRGFDAEELRCMSMGLRGILDFLRGRSGRLEERGER